MTFQVIDVSESGLEFEQMDGIGIKDSHGRGYLSFWKDVKQTEFSEKMFVDGKQSALQSIEQELEFVREEEKKDIEKVDVEDAEQEVLHTMEIPVRNVFPKVSLADIWQICDFFQQ